MRFPKNNTRNHHCQNTFQDIAEKHQKARLRPEYPKRIRGARIAAPIIPDINAVQSPIQISRLKKAKHISDQQTNYPYHFYLFSFLSLTKNFKGVPAKPNVSRI